LEDGNSLKERSRLLSWLADSHRNNKMVVVLFSFLITFGVEFIVLFLFLRKKYSFLYILIFVLLVNLLTQPVVFNILPRFFESRAHYLLLAELSAPIVESIIGILVFKKTNCQKIIALIFLANFVSFVVGLLIV